MIKFALTAIFLIYGTVSFADNCIEQSVNLNKEYMERIESAYALGHKEYIFQKSDLSFFTSEACFKDPFLILKFTDNLKSMGYGVELSKDEIMICQYECDTKRLKNREKQSRISTIMTIISGIISGLIILVLYHFWIRKK